MKPEKVSIVQFDKHMSAGKRYEIECKSSGSRPPANITWWKGSRQIKDDETRVVSYWLEWRKGLWWSRSLSDEKRPDRVKNWRGVTRLSFPSEILTNILLNRIKDSIDPEKLRIGKAEFEYKESTRRYQHYKNRTVPRYSKNMVISDFPTIFIFCPQFSLFTWKHYFPSEDSGFIIIHM